MPNTKYNEKKNYQKEHRICLPYKSRHFFHVIESMQKKVSCMYIYISIYLSIFFLMKFWVIFFNARKQSL